ncbi:zona pellucida protein C isoform X2 [Solea solea]|nr:zona pellucida protein C isoform X2 [Solea solea]XP_058471524.1 zona pellucida protein C isoform X2 [Solea solea]
MHAELPPMMNVPRMQVFCDESRFSVLVDKRINGAVLTAEELQLGNGCSSNGERPNQVVFTYSVDECGTTQKMQNGLVMFTNSVHLTVKEPLAARRQTPSTVHVSCIPERSLFKAVSSESDKTFDIKAMNSSWTSAAESNVYKRGQVVNVQVSANPGAGEQLFIQSCFVSASPDPRDKPRHAVIMNKGCTAPLGSPHPVAQFLSSSRRDVVNLALNTTYLMAEIYIHCTAIISDQGVTTGSKSCNYNLMKSRWEDLSGDVTVCKCCSSKCKSRPHQEGFRATVSTGPFVTVDDNMKTSSTPDASEHQRPPPAAVGDSMQSDATATDTIVSGASLSRSKLSSPLQGVVVVSQEPVSRLILWLPGQVQDGERHNDEGSEAEGLTADSKERSVALNELPEPRPSSCLNPPSHGQDGQRDSESLRRNRFGRSGVLDTDVPQVNILLPVEMMLNDLNFDLNLKEEELTGMQADAAEKSRDQPADVEPIIRSKLQFSKGADGTQTLSYEEEEVMKKPEVMRRGMGLREGKPEHGRKGLRSTFLDFLRRMDKAE